jgi:Na+/H+-dicarboxylate symporter
VAGVAIHAAQDPNLLAVALFVEPIGALWMNAILMTVIPLIVSSLIAGVASTDARLIGRLGGRAISLFLVFVCASGVLTALIAPPLLAWLPIDAATAASLRAGAVAATTAPPGAPQTLREWLVGVVPSNPVRAAADGNLLPLVVFTLAFALAITRVPRELCRTLVGFFQGVAAAMRILVEWILALAPIGVFALTLPLTARLGIAAAGALGYYVAVVSAITALLLLALYPVAVVAGGMSLGRFIRAAAPPQAVAFSSRSSLASLPALIEGAERGLAVPAPITGFCLPLAVSIFKFGGPVVMLTAMLFVSRLYGIDVPPARLTQAIALAVVLSFAVPGVPGGGLVVAAPIFVAAGLPVEALGMLIAVDTIPDIFRTVANVSADLTVVTILARHSRGAIVPAPAVRASANAAAQS